MDARRCVDVSLQLEIDAEPISGRVRSGAGPPRPFYGWLGLASAIDDALTAGRHAACADSPAEVDGICGEGHQDL